MLRTSDIFTSTLTHWMSCVWQEVVSLRSKVVCSPSGDANWKRSTIFRECVSPSRSNWCNGSVALLQNHWIPSDPLTSSNTGPTHNGHSGIGWPSWDMVDRMITARNLQGAAAVFFKAFDSHQLRATTDPPQAAVGFWSCVLFVTCTIQKLEMQAQNKFPHGWRCLQPSSSPQIDTAGLPSICWYGCLYICWVFVSWGGPVWNTFLKFTSHRTLSPWWRAKHHTYQWEHANLSETRCQTRLI